MGPKIKEHDFECEKMKKQLRATGVTGEWDGEINRLNWQHKGYECMLVRNMHTLIWCGYVGVEPGHPAYGKKYDQVDVSVHGGLTYADACDDGFICHTVPPGGEDNVWWLGFDCAHYMDLVPSMKLVEKEIQEKDPGNRLGNMDTWSTYRNFEWVKKETEALADQLSHPRFK